MSDFEPISGINFNPVEVMTLIESGQNREVAGRFLAFMEYFRINRISELAEKQKNYLNLCTKLILLTISREDFEIPNDMAFYFVEKNDIIAKLTALSEYGTTDSLLTEVIKQKSNFSKILFLYSTANKQRLIEKEFFNIDKFLASVWLANLINNRWQFSFEVFNRLKEYISDESIISNYVLTVPGRQFSEPNYFAYFNSSYISEENDFIIRKKINNLIKEDFKNIKVEIKSPDIKKILVCSRNMAKTHAVYKSISPLLHGLKGHYVMDLLHLYAYEEDPDTDLFRKIFTITPDPLTNSFSEAMLQEVLKENYGIIIIPDVGLNIPSIILANLRIAPIQITTYGHPVSTHGSEIDYFIGGRQVEKENSEKNFSETLVLSDGLAVLPVLPEYEHSLIPDNSDRTAICIPWGGHQKINDFNLGLLKRILDKAEKKTILSFIGVNDDNLIKLSVEQELKKMFGDNVMVVSKKAYSLYMSEIEYCDFALDSYHFGSYNTIVDILRCGKPVVTFEGTRSINRLASALLKKLDLSELVATNEEEYINLSLKLINNPDYLREISDFIKGLDIKAKLTETDEGEAFRKAIDSIVKAKFN